MPSNFNLSDVFISYSRIDRDFVRLLHNKLKETEREIWIDWEDIPETADWWEEIKAGIEAANTFVFVVSPASVISPICHDEISHAVNNNKRIVPILYKEVNQADEKSKIHSAITTYNWIFFREQDEFDHAFAILLRALETDLYHVQMHTRILVQAREWENKQENDSYLLFGVELEEALAWLASGNKKPPEPLPLHSEYILASHRVQRRRRRNTLILSFFIAIILGLTLLAFGLAQSATTEANFAQTQVALVSTAEADANNNAATATIAQGQAILQADIAQTQVAVASTAQIEAQNQAAIAQTAQDNALEQAALAATAEFNANNNAATATIAQGQALIQANNAQTQAAIANIAQEEALLQADNAATSEANALDQANNAQTQVALVSTAEAFAIDNAATAVLAYQDAQTQAAIATLAQGDALIQANNAQTQVALVSTAEAFAINNAATAIVAQEDALFQAGIAQTQVALVSTAEANANNNAATAVAAQALAANSQARQLIAEARLVISSNPDIANLLAVEAVLRAPSQEIYDGLFDIIVNTANFRLSPLITAPHIYDTIISPDNTTMITAACVEVDNAGFCIEPELAQFNVETQEKQILSNGESIPQSLALSLDKNLLLVGNRDGSIDMFRFESPTSAHQKSIDAHSGVVRDIAFSLDASTFATASSDGTIKLWNSTDGSLLAESLDGHQSIVFALTFSADGQYIVSGGIDNQVILWSADTLALLDKQSNEKSWVVDVLVNKTNGEVISSGCARRDTANECSAGELLFWNIEDRKLKRSQAVEIADNMIVQLSINAMDTILALGTIDGQTLLYNIQDNKAYGLAFGNNDTLITSLDFVKNDELIVSHTSDGQSRWRLLQPDTSGWKDAACLDAKRNLTQAEWEEYFRFEDYRETCTPIPN